MFGLGFSASNLASMFPPTTSGEAEPGCIHPRCAEMTKRKLSLNGHGTASSVTLENTSIGGEFLASHLTAPKVLALKSTFHDPSAPPAFRPLFRSKIGAETVDIRL